MRVPLAEEKRYTAVAIVLHWAIAAAIVANLALGWWMHRAVEVEATQAQAIAAFQLHKSLGLTVLMLSLLRLAWRLLHRPPPLPAAMAGWERFVAKAAHWAFYALMIVLPLTGWTYVSAQWRGDAPLAVPTLWFGQFEVPHLFDAQALTYAERQTIAARNFTAHFYLAWSMAALLVVHVGAALKHHFVNHDAVLAGMLPLVAKDAPRSRARSAALWSCGFLIPVGLIALVWAVLNPRSASDPGAAAIGTLDGSEWTISLDSEIVFRGTHAGTPFTGRFTRWRAGIRFDPANLVASSVTAIVETGSARDGDALHEETLPQAEWFDAASYPTATFRSTAIQPRADGGFDVEGTLQIKDRELKLAPLLLKLEGGRLTLDGEAVISRREANLGMESDPNAEYLSAEINAEVRVSAIRLR